MKNRWTQDMKNYVNRMYAEECPYSEIKTRFQAEYGFEPSGGQIYRHGAVGNQIRHAQKKKGKWSKAARERLADRMRQSHAKKSAGVIEFCPYCGHTLKAVL